MFYYSAYEYCYNDSTKRYIFKKYIYKSKDYNNYLWYLTLSNNKIN